SKALDISMDTLRNWEMNGLLTVKRKENGYRVYTDDDIRRLKVIRSLRCANYSLEAILRLLQQLSQNPNTDIRATLNTPKQSDDIISVCDRLIVSLSSAEKNAYKIRAMLQDMKSRF
ncbi:MAG: MerR family transcriptional regulator, partial [Candidatus Fimenecus sp.]